MGKIFIAANKAREKEATQQMILLRDRIVSKLRSLSYEVLSVPDDLSLYSALEWINERSQRGDIALAINTSIADPNQRGATVFYIANNTERKGHAELILRPLVSRIPQLIIQGIKTDTVSDYGSLNFCRQLLIPSLILTIGVWNNPEDRDLIVNYSREIALGIVDGLIAWSKEIESFSAPLYSPINICINNQLYKEKGILINGNAYIPIDIVDRLGIDLLPSLHLIQQGGIVYIRAIELREYNLSVAWDQTINTVNLRSIFTISTKEIANIIGRGYTSEVQLIMFLKSRNENALKNFPNLAKFYREEGKIEGVNYDIAFCQMCLETDFLHFSQELDASLNNFARLGSLGDHQFLASFPNAQIGVRAHIQQLKAYGNSEPLVQEIVAPRFHFVKRSIAPSLFQLSRRWSADLNYGEKIIAILRQLYESVNLL